MTKSSSSSLDKLFPEREFVFGDSQKVIVKPIPLSKIPMVLKVFLPLLEVDASGFTNKALVTFICDKSIEFLPLCVDRPLEDIPIALLPDILGAIIEFNFPIETIKKWKALVVSVIGAKKVVGGK